MKAVRAVFFDAGMTLIGPSLLLQELMALVLARHGVDADLDALRAGLDRAEDYYLQTVRSERDIWSDRARILAMWDNYYRTALEAAGVQADEAKLRQWTREIIREFEDPQLWVPYPDVPETLAELRRRGFRQGVISDWTGPLERILAAHGLLEHLDFVLTSGEVGAAKPNPYLFRLALRRVGVSPEQAIHVGDTYWTDVLGARVAGIQPILLDRKATRPPADCPVITSLDELLVLLDGTGASETQEVGEPLGPADRPDDGQVEAVLPE